MEAFHFVTQQTCQKNAHIVYVHDTTYIFSTSGNHSHCHAIPHRYLTTFFDCQHCLSYNVVSLGVVLVVILPKTTNWVFYKNMNSIYDTHHLVHATQAFKIHYDNLHLIIYKPHIEFLKIVISSHHHFMDHKNYKKKSNGKQLTTC
jgi:hypothetical protein